MTPAEFLALFGEAHDARHAVTKRRRFGADVLQAAGVLRAAIEAADLQAIRPGMIDRLANFVFKGEL